VAVLDARMDEVYAASYERTGDGWRTLREPFLGAPEQVELAAGWTLAGQGLDGFDGRLPAGPRVAATPSATALLRLAPAALAAAPATGPASALPLYLRDKVAQTTEERALARARKEALDRDGGAGERQ
jgi:tRNA threonylcarbamoyladenosine biosynthesis protein TsaB